MIVAFCCLCCGRTPATLPRSSTAPNHSASSDSVVELYVGVDPCLAAECWLHAMSVTSCTGWEMSALEKGPERMKVTGTFVQACVKTPRRGREGLCYHPAYLPSCTIGPLCQKQGSGLLPVATCSQCAAAQSLRLRSLLLLMVSNQAGNYFWSSGAC